MEIAVIIIDYKSMKTTCDYIVSFCENIVDSHKCCFCIVDNSCDERNFNKLMQIFEKKSDLEVYSSKTGAILEAVLFDYDGHDVIALKNNSNAGYARGNNIGVEYLKNIMHLPVKYYLVSNNDMIFTKKLSIVELTRPFEKDNVAVVGPKIIEKNGKETSPRKKLSIFRLMVLYNLNLILSNKLKKFVDDIELKTSAGECYWVMGCFLIIDARKFHEVGMFDNDTFLYSEEMILSERLATKGYIMYYFPEIEVFHNHGGTINKHVASYNTVKYLYQSHKICCVKYRKINPLELLLADIVFGIYKIQYPLKRMIKNRV